MIVLDTESAASTSANTLDLGVEMPQDIAEHNNCWKHLLNLREGSDVCLGHTTVSHLS